MPGANGGSGKVPRRSCSHESAAARGSDRKALTEKNGTAGGSSAPRLDSIDEENEVGGAAAALALVAGGSLRASDPEAAASSAEEEAAVIEATPAPAPHAPSAGRAGQGGAANDDEVWDEDDEPGEEEAEGAGRGGEGGEAAADGGPTTAPTKKAPTRAEIATQKGLAGEFLSAVLIVGGGAGADQTATMHFVRTPKAADGPGWVKAPWPLLHDWFNRVFGCGLTPLQFWGMLGRNADEHRMDTMINGTARQNFVKKLVLVPSTDKSANKKGFDTFADGGLANAYVLNNEGTSAGDDVHKRVMERLRTEYDKQRLEAIRRLKSGQPPSTSVGQHGASASGDGGGGGGGGGGGEGGGGGGGSGSGKSGGGKSGGGGASSSSAAAAGDEAVGDAEAAAALAAAAAQPPEPARPYGEDGVYDLALQHADAFGRHWGRFLAEDPRRTEMVAPDAMRAYQEWLRRRIPPSDATYPLDPDLVWYFETIVSVDRSRGKSNARLVEDCKNHLLRHERAVKCNEELLKEQGLGS